MSTYHTVMEHHTCNLTPEPAWCDRCATDQQLFRRRSRSQYPRTGSEPSLLSQALSQPAQQPISVEVRLDDSPPFEWTIFEATTVSHLTQQISAINGAPVAIFLEYDTWFFTDSMRVPMDPGSKVFDYMRSATMMGSDLSSLMLVAQTQLAEGVVPGMRGLQL